MRMERFLRHIKEGTLTFGGPKPPEEIATDENLSLVALDNQFRSERAEHDPWTMTTDKLAQKLPGMGVASLQLPPGVAESYDIREFRIEDEQLLKEAQLSNITEADPE